jgi:hypothetical protein
MTSFDAGKSVGFGPFWGVGSRCLTRRRETVGSDASGASGVLRNALKTKAYSKNSDVGEASGGPHHPTPDARFPSLEGNASGRGGFPTSENTKKGT